jgi:subtilisin family serine protease
VAHEAELVLVAVEARRKAFPSTANVVDAAEYIFAEAQARGRRAVVNLSLGSGIGPHDPNGPLELAMTGVLGDDHRMLVVSAGNELTGGRHRRVPLPCDPIEIDVPPRVGPFVLVDLWYDKADRLDVTVIDPSGQSTPVVVAGHQDVGAVGQDMYEIDSVLNVLRVGDSNIQVKLLTANRRGDISAGRWQLLLHGAYLTSGRDAYAWLDAGVYSSPTFAIATSTCTVTSPATADGVLAVGSYAVAPTLGPLAPSSGWGSDRDGRALEMLAAPGAPVCTCDGGPGAGRLYAVHSGISYAAPHVTGAIAVLLEGDPSLTRAQVIGCLRSAARADADTAGGPAEGWGAGKLDIHAALACAAPASI